MTMLHDGGIRSPRELEEIIEWPYSFCEEADIFDFPLFRFSGLTADSKGLTVAVTVDNEGRFITLDAKITDRDLLYFQLRS